MLIDFKQKHNRELTEQQQAEVVKSIETGLQEGKLVKDLAKELFNIGESTLRNTLTNYGYKIDSRLKKVIKENKGKPKVKFDAEYLISLQKNDQCSFRADLETHNEFKEVAKEAFPSVPLTMLYNLALKEFTDRVNKELSK